LLFFYLKQKGEFINTVGIKTIVFVVFIPQLLPEASAFEHAGNKIYTKNTNFQPDEGN